MSPSPFPRCWPSGCGGISAGPPKESHGYAFVTRYSTGLDGFGIGLKLGINGISLPLFVLAGVVGFAAGLYAIQSNAERMKTYLLLLLVMQAGPHGDVRERRHLLLLLLPRAGADPDLHHGRHLGRPRPELCRDDDDDLPDAGGHALAPRADRDLREERRAQLRPDGAARHAGRAADPPRDPGAHLRDPALRLRNPRLPLAVPFVGAARLRGRAELGRHAARGRPQEVRALRPHPDRASAAAAGRPALEPTTSRGSPASGTWSSSAS